MYMAAKTLILDPEIKFKPVHIPLQFVAFLMQMHLGLCIQSWCLEGIGILFDRSFLYRNVAWSMGFWFGTPFPCCNDVMIAGRSPRDSF